MLPLDSARWGALDQAYGTAEDIPRLLAHLELVTDAQRPELWMGLWRTLWRDGAAFTASYAAVPHLVAFAATRPARERATALHLVGAIEAARRAPDAPPLPGDLRAGYEAALRAVAEVVGACIGDDWDPDTTQVMIGVLAIAKGHHALGHATLHLEPRVACPVCGAVHAPPGWLDAAAP